MMMETLQPSLSSDWFLNPLSEQRLLSHVLSATHNPPDDPRHVVLWAHADQLYHPLSPSSPAHMGNGQVYHHTWPAHKHLDPGE